jgi:hypothetical protein
MSEATVSAAAASAVFLSLVDFLKRPVADQARLKERLEILARAAMVPLGAADRVVLDTADGFAVVVLSSPDTALDVAERALRKAHPLPLRVGINHGPITVAADARGEQKLLGDGLTAAASIAAFAQPGSMLVSRAFRDALSAVDRERAEDLHAAGTFTDAQIRAHEVFAPNARARAARRRRVVMFGMFGVAAIIAVGFAARAVRHAGARRAKRPAFVELAITPWGELIVDGERKGRTPPLERLEVTPGRHTIEIRSGPNPPVTLNVDLAAGENITVRHEFPMPRPPMAPRPVAAPKGVPAGPPPQKTEQPSRFRQFFRDLRKQAENER